MDRKTRKQWIVRWMVLLLLFGAPMKYLMPVVHTEALAAEVEDKGLNLPATVTAAKLNVRRKPSISAKQIMYKKQPVYLTQGRSVTILSEIMAEGTKWYLVIFNHEGVTKKGYAMAQYIALTMNSTTVKGTVSNSEGAQTTTLYQKPSVSAAAILTGDKGLKNGQAATILREKTVNNVKWYKITLKLSGTRYRGYIQANHFALKQSAGIRTAKVNVDVLNVRVGAGTNNAVLTYSGQSIRLSEGDVVNILGQKKQDGIRWYHVSFKYNGVTLSGFVMGEYVTLQKGNNEPKQTPTPSPTTDPDKVSDSAVTVSPTPGAIETPAPTNPTDQAIQPATAPAITEEAFSKTLASFPESYQPLLKELHARYPSFQFTAYQTGLDWSKVIENENVVGLNLIPNAKGSEWKSILEGAYDWSTDTYIPFDGQNWVTCSQACLEYYMDPRNFMTADGIFQFENLSYNSENQTISGVNTILAGTALANKSYSYTDKNGVTTTKTYAQTFIDAAKESGVSPYYLASRVKQEVLGGSTVSDSISGKASGYEGYYNFYNIGSENSTILGQNTINGLIFAKTGSNLSEADKATFMIPWNNPYKSIVGGAKLIGNNYINRGQNTIYLQKFNVTSYSRYSHQYMGNVEAAKTEAQKIYAAYKDMSNVSAIFSIPVYNNMPAQASPIPSGDKNQNNWLKTLSVTSATGKKELVMSPQFQVSDDTSVKYSVMVDSNVAKVKIDAEAVSAKSIVDGTGIVQLKAGVNTFKVTVTSEAKTTRTYTIVITKTS